MIRRLSPEEARFVIPLELESSREAVHARLTRTQLELAAQARLEAHLRAKLPNLLLALLGSQANALSEALKTLILDELSKLEQTTKLEVRAHPATLRDLQASPELEPHLQGGLIFVADETLTPGGIVMQSARGVSDARLETRVEAFVSALLSRGDAP